MVALETPGPLGATDLDPVTAHALRCGWEELDAVCDAETVMPIFQAHGTADGIIPFFLGEMTLNFWLRQNQCTDQVVYLPNGCQHRPDCRGRAEVVWCRFQGVGHIPIWMTDFPMTDEIWSFIENHHLP